jgi:hypothetical protein
MTSWAAPSTTCRRRRAACSAWCSRCSASGRKSTTARAGTGGGASCGPSPAGATRAQGASRPPGRTGIRAGEPRPGAPERPALRDALRRRPGGEPSAPVRPDRRGGAAQGRGPCTRRCCRIGWRAAVGGTSGVRLRKNRSGQNGRRSGVGQPSVRGQSGVGQGAEIADSSSENALPASPNGKNAQPGPGKTDVAA